MKNKKRKFAALALCVTLLVGLLATTFSSADDFNAPEDPIVLAGADEITNIERIQSCYNSNLKTIVTNANLPTGATSFKVLEILPGEATTTIPSTTFENYVRSGMFASEVLVCDGVSVPNDMVELSRVTAGTLCAKGDGSKEAILEYLLEFDLVYVNNTDNYDKKGETPLADVETDTANMFFKTFDFTASGAEAFLTYATSESAPLLMDYNIYPYLNPTTLPGSSIVDPDLRVNLNLAALAYSDFSTNRFSGYSPSGDGHFVFPINDVVMDTPNNILTYLDSNSNWKYPNGDEAEKPVTGEVIDAVNNEVSVESVAQYKVLEIVAQLPEDGSKTPLQQLADEERTIQGSYFISAVDGDGNPILNENGEQVLYIAHPVVNRLEQAFFEYPDHGGEITVEICTPGSIPTDLSGYSAIFINIAESDYDTLLINDITESEKALLAEYSSKYQRDEKYLYYEESIANTYDPSGTGNISVLAVDYAYNIVKNVINTTTLKSKYSNVVLIDYLFINEEGETPDTAKIQAMINTAAYKGILPSSSDRKFNVLEIQPAAPVPFKSTDGAISNYYKPGSVNVAVEERLYKSPDGKEFRFMLKPQGTINTDGSFQHNGNILAVYTDGNGGYYFVGNGGEFVVYESPALLSQSVNYVDKVVSDSDSSDLGIRAVYDSIQFRGQTYSYTEMKSSSNKYEVVYTSTSSSNQLFISKSQAWFKQSSGITNIGSAFYDEMEGIGDPKRYVSFKSWFRNDRTQDYFVYELYKENVTINDGINPSGTYDLYVAPKSGYFMYEDEAGNLYVFNGYTKNMYDSDRGFSRVSYESSSETGIYSYHITKSKIADLIGIDESKINIDNYTVSELNCKVDDLVNTYDLVVIGGDVSALREFPENTKLSQSKYYRKMDVDSNHAYDMYFHTGDITLRDEFYEDSSAENSVLIGTQRNSNGKYVYISSGMDLSYTKQQELYTYINSGRPVLIESEVIDVTDEKSVVSTRIDPASYMGVMLRDIAVGKNSGDYDNVLTGFDYDDYKIVNDKVVYNDATKSKIMDTINSESSIIRPTLNIISKPLEYQDDLPKEIYAERNGHTFSVEYNIGSEAGNRMDYEVNLYFDVDMDGRFSEEEIYNTQNYCTGVDKNKVMEYELVDTFFGILSWKLEATYTNSKGAVTQVSQLGYAGYDKAAGEIEKLKVLQIIPQSSCQLLMCVDCDRRGSLRETCNHRFGIMKYDGSGNSGNWMDEFVFKDYFDIDLEIQTVDKFCTRAYENAYAPGSAVRNPNWLIDSYDMIVIGFHDSYGNKDFTKVACAELIKFSEVNSLLCSHDNIGIINSGARYDASFYGVEDGTVDPDYHSEFITTSWAYNTSHYYNPGDPIYDSSIRYIYGAARFFTLDENNPYTNDEDGSEFYTDYGVTTGPTSKFMSGVFGGQTDACLGWRIGSDTSPYKNDGYYGVYNDTRKVRSTNDGIITRYPFALLEKFTIDTTHSQYAQLDLDVESTTVWYCLDSTVRGDATVGNFNVQKDYNMSIYTISPNDGRNSYYIYSNKNVTYTGAGHSDITPSFDNNYERKLFINTVFLSFNAMNNPPIIKVEGDNIITSDDVKIKDPNTQVDAQATVSSTSAVFEYDLKVIDDLPDRYFTGLIYIDKKPNGEEYDKAEDILVGIIKYNKGTDDYIYYDLLKNGETRRMTSLQLKPEYFTGAESTTHLSLQIYDRFPYSMADIKNGNVSSVFEEQRSSKSLYSIYTIRINAQGVVDMNLWELN